MPSDLLPAVFFDIGQTLGIPKFSATPPFRITGLDLYPHVPNVLARLRARPIRLGILSHIGPINDQNIADVTAALQSAGIYDSFDPLLLVYGKKDTTAIFLKAAERAGFALAPQHCLFVGEDAGERALALEAGMRVAPHPELAEEVLDDSALHFVRLTIPREHRSVGWRQSLLERPVVPVHVTGPDGTVVYAITSARAAAELDDLGFEVLRLGTPNLPRTTEAYLLRDDKQSASGFLQPEGQSKRFFATPERSSWVLGSTAEGVFIALPAGQAVEEIHFAGAGHGHHSRLLPDKNLLRPFGSGPNDRGADFARPAEVGLVEPALSDEQRKAVAGITPEALGRWIDRLSGVSQLSDTDALLVRSRHVRSAENVRVTDALAAELAALGLAVRRHGFRLGQHDLVNVEAELAGDGPEVVVVSAHLDSTASGDAGFDPVNDPAPGADDDASGVAAILAIAAAFGHLATARRPARTVRFLLFNAEEQGLVGSRAYARDQAAVAVPIVAVFQMDMIGHRGDSASWPFEVHAGYAPSDDVRGRSVVLAERVRHFASELSPNLAVQVYIDPDPAAGRSDHASFQERGYAACAITEDFFVGPDADSPNPRPNPNYHRRADRGVDLIYAAAIARAVAAAALVTAG